MNIGGLEVRNTRSLLDENTRFCGLVYSASGMGKTTFGASLDALTKKHLQKPTLFIALEAGEGGGTMSIQSLGIEFVIPSTMAELERLIAALANDRVFGGVVLDSATEYVNRFLKPYALKFPSRDKLQTREAGVPERSDYQTMGEKCRQHLNQLIALSCHPDLSVRKHIVVTALEKEKTDDKGNVTAINPDLPGAMGSTATAMFQTVGAIQIRTTIIDDPSRPGTKIRKLNRILNTQGDGIRHIKDRTNILPSESPANLLDIWEGWWLPKLEKMKKEAAIAC